MDSHGDGAAGRRLLFRHTGPPAEALELTPFDPRPPAPGEVLVRVLAAAINPADLNVIAGNYGIKPTLPAVAGVEGCGRVAVSRSPAFQPGDVVIFLSHSSTWSTHATVAASSLFKLPPGIAWEQAAMIKTNPATAWRLLQGFVQPQPGGWVVQNLGNSAVGRCVIQLARDLNLRTVTLVRRPGVMAELRSLGADHVFLDDDEGVASALAALGGSHAALAFNGVGGDSALRLMSLLRDGATHITYGAMGRRPLTIPNGPLIFRDIHVRGLWITRWIAHASSSELHTMYAYLSRRVAEGALVQRVDSTFPLEEYRDALARVDAPDRNGKVLFRMTPAE